MNPDTQLALDEAAAAPAVAFDLSTVDGILAEMARQDCTFRVALDGSLFRGADGKTKFRGNPTAELWAAILARRAEVLAAYEARALAAYEADHNRWLRAPEEETGLPAQTARLNDAARRLIEEHVCNQLNRSLAAHNLVLGNWLQAREILYAAAGQDPRDASVRAGLDLVCWQRRTANPREALEFLEGLEAAARVSARMEDGGSKMKKTDLPPKTAA